MGTFLRPEKSRTLSKTTWVMLKPGVNPATYVMAPPTASASPIVTPTSVYPTSTYHPYPPPQATPVAAAAAPVQVYDANTKTSYYAQPPVSPIKNASYLFIE